MSLSEGMQNLANEEWFTAVLETWGRSQMEALNHQISQHDAAEFVSSWMDQLCLSIFDMRWERRLENGVNIELIDESARTYPLHLQFTPFQLTLRQSSLQSLITHWHQVDGMVAALLAPSDCVCIHIERCVAMDEPPYVKRCTVAIDPEEDCTIPLFSTEGLAVELLEYSVVAVQAHVGSDQAGHYRTALRILPSVTQGVLPSAWLLCDDARPPEPV